MKNEFSPRRAVLSVLLSLVFFALYFIVQVLSVNLVGLFVPEGYASQLTLELSIVAGCISILVFALILRFAKIPFAQGAYLNKFPPRFIINSVIMGVATTFAITLILGLVQMAGLIPAEWISVQNDAYSDVTSASPFMQFLSVGLMAPLLEELLFRGLILGTLKENMHPWVAIAISAILFGLAHGTPLGMIYATGLGIFMGWIFVKFNSILPVIIFHMAYNCTVAYSGGISLIVAILAIPILIFEVMDINKYFRGKQQ